MPAYDSRDVARLMGQLWDHILSLEERNEQPEEVVVPAQADEDLDVSDDVTADARTGNNKYLTYDQDSYSFREFK